MRCPECDVQVREVVEAGTERLLLIDSEQVDDGSLQLEACTVVRANLPDVVHRVSDGAGRYREHSHR